VLKGCRKLLILPHNNPDPDAIASALALKYLVREKLGIRSQIALAGIISRAENQALVRELKVRLTPVSQINIQRYKYIALVDTQPGFGNNCFPPKLTPTIVIDHHPLKSNTRGAFIDVRPQYGASAAILTEYLLDNGLKPPPRICTALSFGISSETEDLGREASPQDVRAFVQLFPRVALKTLSRIKNPRLSSEYYYNLDKALHHAFIYKHVIGSKLGWVNQPDVVSQIADMLLKRERTSWSICIARWQNRLIVSIRTQNKKAKAGKLLRRILAGRGNAGGHDMIAGGQIDCSGLDEAGYAQLEQEIIGKFFKVLGFKQEIQLRRFLPSPANSST
jgi:nanoRNase/pAp phosphatase (c-di-AMP/oligoRNAs hydrolase)